MISYVTTLAEGLTDACCDRTAKTEMAAHRQIGATNLLGMILPRTLTIILDRGLPIGEI